VGWRVADWAIPSKGEHSLYIEFDPEKYWNRWLNTIRFQIISSQKQGPL